MDELENIPEKLKGLKKENPFQVPEGYFDQFSERLMDRIEVEKTPAWYQKVFHFARPQFALAASFASLAILAFLVFTIIVPGNNSIPSLDEISAVLEDEAYLMSSGDLYAYFDITIDDEESDFTSIDNIDLTEEEILQYLDEEGVDFDIMNDEF